MSLAALALPPGPTNVWATTRAFARDPIGLHQALQARYGDPFTLRILGQTTVVTGRAETIRALYGAPASSFRALDILRPLVGDASLLVTSGEAHLKDRRLLAPFFHGSRLQSYAETARAAARHALEAIPSGVPCDVLPPLQSFSFELIARAVCGLNTDTEIDDLKRLMQGTIVGGSPALLFFPFLQRAPFGYGPWGAFLRARQALDLRIAGWIQVRRGAPPTSDILSRLLDARDESGAPLSDSAIRDHLVTFLVAGLESTAMTMAWLLAAVARDARSLRRLETELRALPTDPNWAELDDAPYLDAVVVEALRRFPITVQTSRVLQEPFELGGRVLPAGVAVAASLALAQLSSEAYADPLRFAPERHLGQKRNPASWLPFGGGARRCLGASLAEFAMKQACFVFFREATWAAETAPLPRSIRHTLLMGPETPLYLRRLS